MRSLSVFLIATGCWLLSQTTRAQDAQLAAQLAALSWLAGCWSAEGGEPGSGEHWLPLAGGSMLGVSRTIRNGKTVSHEFMQIRASTDGKIVFIALPSGQRETTFPLSSLAEDEVTFENPQHDFPQRVIYRSLPGERLNARLEGIRRGKLQSIEFRMNRAACDSLATPAPRK